MLRRRQIKMSKQNLHLDEIVILSPGILAEPIYYIVALVLSANFAFYLLSLGLILKYINTLKNSEYKKDITMMTTATLSSKRKMEVKRRGPHLFLCMEQLLPTYDELCKVVELKGFWKLNLFFKHCNTRGTLF